MSARYLYLQRETGRSPYAVSAHPTAADRACVRFGLLEIIRLRDLKRLTPGGCWLPVETGVLRNLGEGKAKRELGHVP